MKRMIVLLGLAALVSTPAIAAERGFYFGMDVGQYAYDLDQRGIDRMVEDTVADVGLAVIDGQSETSEDGFTYGIILGYQILPYLAVEAAYVDLGDAEYKARGVVTDGVTTAEMNAQLTAESSGPTVSVLGILPVFASGWEVYGRAGVYFASNDVAASVAIDGISESASDSSNSTEFLWGVGAGYTRGDWTVRLDFQQFTDVGDSDSTGDVNVNRIVLGAVYRY
jgi:opacity protein-like surface antigen